MSECVYTFVSCEFMLYLHVIRINSIKQLDVAVSPPAFVCNSCLTLTQVTLDLDPRELWPLMQIPEKHVFDLDLEPCDLWPWILEPWQGSHYIPRIKNCTTSHKTYFFISWPWPLTCDLQGWPTYHPATCRYQISSPQVQYFPRYEFLTCDFWSSEFWSSNRQKATHISQKIHKCNSTDYMMTHYTYINVISTCALTCTHEDKMDIWRVWFPRESRCVSVDQTSPV